MYVSRRRKDAAERLRYLWPLGCEKWLSCRKEQWNVLAKGKLSEDDAKTLNICKDYFVFGKVEGYIAPILQFGFTPYDSSDSAREVFNSELFDVNDRSQILQSYVLSAPYYLSDMSWIRQHVVNFVRGVQGDECVEIVEKVGRSQTVISPEPTYWCKAYSASATQLLSGKIDRYDGCVDSVDYFTSALKYATKEKFRKRINVDKLLAYAEDVLVGPASSLYARELASNLKLRENDIGENWAASSTASE
jgi:hypothetical protein